MVRDVVNPRMLELEVAKSDPCLYSPSEVFLSTLMDAESRTL
jgi:hypothetical protein